MLTFVIPAVAKNVYFCLSKTLTYWTVTLYPSTFPKHLHTVEHYEYTKRFRIRIGTNSTGTWSSAV